MPAGGAAYGGDEIAGEGEAYGGGVGAGTLERAQHVVGDGDAGDFVVEAEGERVAAEGPDADEKGDGYLAVVVVEQSRLSQVLALVERLESVARRHNTAAGAIAVARAPRKSAVEGAIVGFRFPKQVDPILSAASIEPSVADVESLTGP